MSSCTAISASEPPTPKIVITFLLMLGFLYSLLSRQDEKSAGVIMAEKTRDIVRQIELNGDGFGRNELTIGTSGAVLLARDGVIFNTPYGRMDGVTLMEMGVDLEATAPEEAFRVGSGGLAGICVYARAGNDVVVAYLPDSEIYAGRNQNAAILLSGLLGLFIVLYIGISRLVQASVVQKVQDVNASLLKIQGGNLNERVNVGGDFYDFYMLDLNTLVFLIADVSGKGIPAAMFMMTGKTTLRDASGRFEDIGEMMSFANNRLYDGNEAEMFITAWMGILNLSTGEIRFANAGHNPPVLMRDGHAEYLDMDVKLVLAMIPEDTRV